MPNIIMHVDMDAFFAAVEQRDHPEYRGKPVIVGALPGRRGVVATCSYEARAYGIHSAMPIAHAYKRCPHAVYLRPRLGKYGAVSKEVMAVLESISPQVEPISIDEAFVDITGMDRLIGPPEAVGRRTKARIREGLGLTASVGIGPNRLVAKIASDLEKPDGLTVVAPEDVLDFLAPLPVATLRGVGPKTLETLMGRGVRTVEALRNRTKTELARWLGEKGAESLYRQARGIGSDRVGEGETRKSISKEVTFNEDLQGGEPLREVLLELASGVGRIARREGLRGRVVVLKIRLPGFITHTRQSRLEQATASDRRIFTEAWSLYMKSGFVDKPVRLIGVGISDWEGQRERQLDLFAQGEDHGDDDLFSAVDEIKDRFGSDAIRLGRVGSKKEGRSGGSDWEGK